MQMPVFVRFAPVFIILLAAGCNNASDAVSNLPTAPTATSTTTESTTLALSSISTVPDGTGVQFNTDFQFTAQGSFPSGTQFVWRFGDGSATTTNTPTASRVFGQAGVFNVSVEARAAGATASAARPVSVRSIIGRWTGTVTGFTSYPAQRPVAITGFELQVIRQTLAEDGRSLMLEGRWADDAGCREARVEFVRQLIQPEPTATVTFGVNGLSCASGDFFLTGLADATFDRVEGHCNVTGTNPNCRFSMRRE
jgi:hypothetical protein